VSKVFYPRNSEEVYEAYVYAKNNDLIPFPLGGGSNTLIGHLDKIVLISDRRLHNEIRFHDHSDDKMIVSSNINIGNFILNVLGFGLGGLEFLAGIPAHIGGLICMNAGAHGKCISDFVEWVDVVNLDGMRRISREELKFNYRFSNIDGFITLACLKLKKVSPHSHKNEILTSVMTRRSKYPMTLPNLGCFFQNPIDNHAGFLIEQSGLKAYQIGGARVNELHANFLVNVGNATFEDFISLIDHVKTTVHKKHNILLKEEVRIING
jgi:UDP-N-acetylmuramate dehydrogenase